MSIERYQGIGGRKPVRSAEAMMKAIKEVGIIPFFVNPIPGFSIEDLTPREFWFDNDEELGPWDWKVDVVQSGEIAYGKFLYGGKVAFATPEWYRELMNWRRSQERYQPSGMAKEVYEAVVKAETISPSELRKAFGVKKAQMDTVLMHLAQDCLIVTGDIKRVYRGPDLHYNGWQTSSVCTPDSLFLFDGTGCEDEDFAAVFHLRKGPKREAKAFSHTPEESFDRLFSHIRGLFPDASDKAILKALE